MPHLYAHHLSRSPSFSISNNVITGPFTDNSLPRLRRLFNQEIKRNLFEAYLRPQQTAVSLVSTTTSSSASFPGGEAFEFAFSPNGYWTLALSSSRIYVIDTLSPKISVQREFKVLRRPLSAAILDDGSILAVLSSHHQVNIYGLSNLALKHLRSLSLDNRPHALAMSPKGEVLAAAYDGGIEVHSLAPSALATERRSVKCDTVDAIRFSNDGTMLLGTTQTSKNSNTVVLTAPYFTEGNSNQHPSDVLGHMWTSQIIFPNSSRDCSHATLLPHPTEGDSCWTFAYDRVFESFRAVRTDDMRNGTTYFTGPKPRNRSRARASKNDFIPCTLPATSDRGELVAAGFAGKDVWLYGVPESLDISNLPQIEHGNSPSIVLAGSRSSSSSGSNPRSPATSLTRGESAELTSLPQWQVLVDKYRNIFAKGRLVAEVPGVSGVRWVSRRHERLGEKSLTERLIITAPGGVSGPSELEQDDFASVDGGRLVILDFDRRVNDGKLEQMNFELGNVKPELLPEGNVDMETEVNVVRQRTVRKQRGTASRASVAEVLAAAPPLPAEPVSAPAVPSLTPRSEPSTAVNSPIHSSSDFSPTDGLTLEEASAAFDGPYSHTAPRSRNSLYRSATAVAANRQRNPPRIVESGHIAYRRADGRGELPHESDADNWVPPPPPYTAKPDAPLPEHLRMTLVPRRTEPTRPVTTAFRRPRRARTAETSSPPSSVSSPRSACGPATQQMSIFAQRSESFVSSQTDFSGPSRSVSETERSRPISPVSSLGTTLNRTPTESPSRRRRDSLGSLTRRPLSAYASSQRRPHTARLTSPISSIPEPLVPTSQPGNSVSLPSSPNRDAFSNLTLSGANLQHRLEYPLPPTPQGASREPAERPVRSTPARVEPSAYTENIARVVNQSVPEFESLVMSMPSAQQLANLNSRVRDRPAPQSNTRLPMGHSPPSSYPTPSLRPSPPRGALGAAGGRSSRSSSRRSSIHEGRSSFAASSPALLRPSARRLETIQSVSSFLSRSGTRSRSRDAGAAGGVVGSQRRRSVDLAEPSQGVARRKSFFGGRRKPKIRDDHLEYRDDSWQRVNEQRDTRSAKCIQM